MRAFLRVLLLAVAPVLVVVVPAAAPSHACSCEQVPFDEALTTADAVFTGTVLEDPVRDDAGNGAFRVDVQRVYRGEVPETVRLTTAQESACGLAVAEGEEWVFASAGEDFVVSQCGGSSPATEVDTSDVEAVTGPGGPPEPGGVAPPDAGEESEVANVVTRLLVGLALVFVGAAAVLVLLMIRGWARDQR